MSVICLSVGCCVAEVLLRCQENDALFHKCPPPRPLDRDSKSGPAPSTLVKCFRSVGGSGFTVRVKLSVTLHQKNKKDDKG